MKRRVSWGLKRRVRVAGDVVKEVNCDGCWDRIKDGGWLVWLGWFGGFKG